MIKVLTFVLGISLFLGLAQPVAAIELHADDRLVFEGEEALDNAYLAGSEVRVTAPVTNDLVVAGSEVRIDTEIEGGLLAAASQLQVNGTVNRNARIAGGEVTLNGDVGQDVVVFGGEVVIGSEAQVAGDVVFAGGSLVVNGVVTGTLLVNCQCNVTINGAVGGVQAEQVGKLTLGRQAIINGNLQYSSAREADVDREATVNGSIDYSPTTSTQSAVNQFRSLSFFYGMISSFILALVLLLLFRAVSDVGIAAVRKNVLLTFGLGIAWLVILPMVAVTSFLVSVWLGLALLLLYLLSLILGFGLAQLILGWWLLQWWLGRTKQSYELDWRAAVIGVLATTVLMFTQVLGWFIIFLLMLLALGGLVQGLWQLRQPLPAND